MRSNLFRVNRINSSSRARLLPLEILPHLASAPGFEYPSRDFIFFGWNLFKVHQLGGGSLSPRGEQLLIVDSLLLLRPLLASIPKLGVCSIILECYQRLACMDSMVGEASPGDLTLLSLTGLSSRCADLLHKVKHRS